MAKYNNLPGVTLELLDGNIATLESLKQPIAIVIGRSYSGPNRTPLVLDDNSSASFRFGSGSPLIEAATRIKAGGIPTVIVYRVGGKEAVLKDFAGAGSTLTTKEASVLATSNLRVYLGPSENDPAKAALIVFYGTVGNKIVYSNAPGAEIDLGFVTVENFDNTTTNVIGSPTEPVLLSTVVDYGVYSTGSMTHTVAGGVSSWVLTGATALNFKKIVSVTKNGTAITTGYTADISGSDILFSALTPTNGDIFVITFQIGGPLAGATLENGDDGFSLPKNDYYELVDQALRDSETTVAKFIRVLDAPLDEENIADGSTATDKLTYLNLTEEDGEYSYEWSNTKALYKLGAGNTTDPTLADKDGNGQPIVLKRFNEVSYAHRIGMFCQAVAENDGFVLAAIETKAPKSLSVKDISKYVGVSPVVDSASGLTIANGTGLLGNKFMNGSTTTSKGLFATDNGFPDGTVLSDSGGFPIDIGKFLNVVGQYVTYGNKVVSGADHYLGIIGSTTIGDSTTNRLVSGVSLPYQVKKSKLDELTGAGYVTFITKADGVHVVSGELATTNKSDYQYVSTSLIIQDLVSQIRTVSDRYIGKGMTQVMVASLRTAIDSILRAAAAELKIERGTFDVLVTGPGKVTIPLVIVPANELRQLYIPISLSANV